MSQITEIAWFKATPAFQADHSLVDSTLSQLKKLDGLVSTHLGFQTEDPSIAYIVNVWDSLEHHKAVTSHPSYGAIFGALKPALDGEVEISAVKLTSSPEEALSQPVTEIAHALLAPGHSEEELNAFFSSVSGLGGAKGYHWGPAVGKDNTYIALVGWASLDAHKAAHDDAAYLAVTGKAKGLLTPQIKHAKFVRA
ncbi:hypothetical protein PLICRDRAFT_44333 [Plicaturopsis crispa FD-325 SS-3]|nr:hypothetical protein PLICRDRAFT_44333 [Plicaturopsis crispa FD-325 SS-3]